MEQLQTALKQTSETSKNTKVQVQQIQSAVNAFVSLEDSFKGKGANSIRSYYRETHIPFLLFLEGFLTEYEDTLAKIGKSLTSLEPDNRGFIREGFLEGEVKQGLRKAENVTMSLTDEVNRSISSVRDLISLPNLDDHEFLSNINRSRKKIDETIEHLHTFDSKSSKKLDKQRNDLNQMKQYLQELRSLLSNRDISIINYQHQELSKFEFQKGLLDGIRDKGRDNALTLETLLGTAEQNLLSRYIPSSQVFVSLIQDRFEKKTLDYSRRAMNAVTAITGDRLSAEEFATIESQVHDGVEVSDYKSEWNGFYHMLIDGRMVREYKNGDGNVSFEFVDHIPDNRLKPQEKEKNVWEKNWDVVAKAGKDVVDGVTYVGKETADFLVLDDLRTLKDENASNGDKAIALASFIPIPAFKAYKLVKVGKFNKQVPSNGVKVKKAESGEVRDKGKGNGKLSPSNYPNPDPPMSLPPVRYEPKTIEEVRRMRQGKGPTTKMMHGDKNIEAHHRQQVPVKNGGMLDELEQRTHRGEGNHTRHDKPAQLTPSQRAKEIREHYKERGKEFILPGEGI